MDFVIFCIIYCFSAFFNWKRAAHQSFPMARIRVGDHHWYGLGVALDYSSAAVHYRIASHNTDAKAAAQVRTSNFKYSGARVILATKILKTLEHYPNRHKLPELDFYDPKKSLKITMIWVILAKFYELLLVFSR